MNYWTFKHKPGKGSSPQKTMEIVQWAYGLSSAIMQYEYNYQGGATTQQWNKVLEIVEGDIIFLRGDKAIHAVGKAIKPRKTADVVLKAKSIIEDNSHGIYFSGEYEGCIHFEDSDVFFEDLSGGEGKWGQRIDVDRWEFFYEKGVEVKDSDFETGSSPFSVVRKLNLKNAEVLLKKLKEKNMDNLSFEERIKEKLLHSKNIILTGAPGTGKTYLAYEIAKSMILKSMSKKDIINLSFDKHIKSDWGDESLEMVDDSWLFWKSRILSEDFNLDDFANTISNISDTERMNNGYYLMNFLERTSAVYGSSKPGNAFNYGIKLNNDNKSYTIFSNRETPVNRNIAEQAFNQQIKPWLIEFIKANETQKIELVEKGNSLIRAGQLLRKMIVLEYPAQYLSIYQDSTIQKAYDFFIKGNQNSYFEQSREILNYFLKKHKLERTKENQRKVSEYIWSYFSKSDDAISMTQEDEMIGKYTNEHCEFVQFHPSYDYTDFVEGLRPVKKDGSDLGFELRDGIFKSFCKKALKAHFEDAKLDEDKKRKYVFVIDEINRGEISKIFGELFFSIDPGYRGKDGLVTTQFHNLISDEDTFIDGFYVPENVYIIGTMNDIDRSVETFDFAMRRRFTWIEIKATERTEMLNETLGDLKEQAVKKMNAINSVIENTEGLNLSYHIGPAYFLNLKNHNGSFDDLWKYNIEPLIKEYLRGLPSADIALGEIKNAYFSDGEQIS